MFYLVLLFTATIVLLHILAKGQPKSKLPKGPRGVPILGNLLQIVGKTHVKLSSWALEFGGLYTIKLGSRNALVISDLHHAKEIFSNSVSTGKFKNDTFLLLSRGPYGILKTDGKLWAEQRRFSLQTLKSFGFDGKSLEPTFLSEAQCLIDWIKLESSKANDGAIFLKNALRLVAVNSLWTLIAGEKLPLEDSTLSITLDEFMASFHHTMETGLGYLPWLKYVAPKMSGYLDLDEKSKKLHAFLKKYFVNANEKQTSCENLISSYIRHMKAVNDPESSFYGPDGERNGVAVAAEFFIAGSETIANTINWLIFYLCVHQDIQEKMLREIDEILGKPNEPSLSDRSRMPYTEAVILETLRYSSLVFMGNINELVDDFVYKGYYIPKGTLLICNVYHIHFDKSVWGDPENFRPERFLEENSTKLRSHLIPFLTGKRTCLADNYSKDLLFLFIVKIFQNFRAEKHLGVPREEYFEPIVGQILQAPLQKVVMQIR